MAWFWGLFGWHLIEDGYTGWLKVWYRGADVHAAREMYRALAREFASADTDLTVIYDHRADD